MRREPQAATRADNDDRIDRGAEAVERSTDRTVTTLAFSHWRLTAIVADALARGWQLVA
jgi:hypothetical protein